MWIVVTFRVQLMFTMDLCVGTSGCLTCAGSARICMQKLSAEDGRCCQLNRHVHSLSIELCFLAIL